MDREELVDKIALCCDHIPGRPHCWVQRERSEERKCTSCNRIMSVERVLSQWKRLVRFSDPLSPLTLRERIEGGLKIPLIIKIFFKPVHPIWGREGLLIYGFPYLFF